ncbi:MAG: Nre family DNA repair protein [Nitrosopumilaceae archaeon]|nr:Nre family DNA repair protein [Nitrosopumilaceae archaeon]
MPQNSVDVRKAIEAKWNEYLSRYGNLFSSDNISGSSPPSVFVGSYSYPKVNVGPMVPPIHGDTTLLDSPEKWIGKTLEDIVNYRLNLVRGIQKVSVNNPTGRYIENLQDVAMSTRPTDSDIQFEKPTAPITLIDGHSAPFGPIGEIKKAKFSNAPAERQIEKVYYDKDLKASDAVLKLYNNGIDISKIQKCFSIGMMGHKRKLVPTRWSITATDDIISQSLIDQILDAPKIDSHKVFFFEHMGNLFSVILFPHRWLYEMTEAWYSNGVLGFGSDHEDARGINHPPAIAGAYYAAKLAVGEYLVKNKIQAGVLILREIRPEYAIPVGVWQIREGVRAAMKERPIITESFEHSLNVACKPLSISKQEWLSKGVILKLMKQKTLSDFF